MTTIPAEYPAEETKPGMALQRVNAINPRTGKFSHQVIYLGTVEQARALAEIFFYERHGQSEAMWHHLRGIIDGTIPEPADPEL